MVRVDLRVRHGQQRRDVGDRARLRRPRSARAAVPARGRRARAEPAGAHLRGGFVHVSSRRLDSACGRGRVLHLATPAWLRDAVAPHEGRVCTQQYEFVYTRAELGAWERGEETLADRARPIGTRRRHFYVEPVAELRFCRYRRGMRWGHGHNLPFNPGHTSVERIGVRHYRWRDPVQMEQRCRLRAICARLTHHGPHWAQGDWRSWVVGDDDPRLKVWNPGEPLPARRGLEHQSPPLRRLAQRVLYSTPIPSLLDRGRPTWSDGPKAIPFPEMA